VRADRSYEKGIALQVTLLLPSPEGSLLLEFSAGGTRCLESCFSPEETAAFPSSWQEEFNLRSSLRSWPVWQGRGKSLPSADRLWACRLHGRGLRNQKANSKTIGGGMKLLVRGRGIALGSASQQRKGKDAAFADCHSIRAPPAGWGPCHPCSIRRAAPLDGQRPSPASAKPKGFQSPQPVNL